MSDTTTASDAPASGALASDAPASDALASGALASGAAAGGASAQEASQPSEEELRAAYEAELSRITSADLILQTAASLLNLGARRLGLTSDRRSAPHAEHTAGSPIGQPEAERDLEQVRDAIDGVRGLLPILERRTSTAELAPLRDALSQLQMAYARQAPRAATAHSTGAVQGGEGAGAGPSGRPGEQAGGGQAGGERAGGGQRAGEERAGGGETGDEGSGGGSPNAPPGAPQPRRPGPAEASGRLWVPGR